MYTSTMLDSPSKSESHTPARISSLRQHLAGPADEELEHVELAGGEGHLDVADEGPPLGRLDPQVADRHRCRPRAGRSAEQGPDPGDEHRERERLGEVVVGAGVERLGLVEVAVLGREHQDRGPDAGGPEVGADLEAVAAGQHDVEHDQVEGALGGPPQAVEAVSGDLDAEALGFQAPLDGGGDLGVVLHQQQLHRRHGRTPDLTPG